MDTNKQSAENTIQRVYIREIAANDIANILNKKDIVLDGQQILYAIHLETGERVAVFSERESAFAAARIHGVEPVSTH